MVRWEGGARRRLQQAALELFAEHGYASTTVAAVAARAGLTERTYFRHFPDKREVLFGDDEHLLGVLLAPLRPPGTLATDASPEPMALTRAALTALARELDPRREEVRLRDRVIAGDPELVERDLGKQARWTAQLRGALVALGVPAHEAALSAALGGAVLRVAYLGWLAEHGGDALEVRLSHALDDAGRLLAGRALPQAAPGGTVDA